MDYISKRIGRAPLLKKNPFYERFHVPALKQPNIMYSSIDMQAIHTALMHRTMYGPSRPGMHGTTLVSDPRIDTETSPPILSLLRTCNGYNIWSINVPMQRIPIGSFTEMCRFLKIHPLQALTSTKIDVWDSETDKILRLSLYETRKRWTD